MAAPETVAPDGVPPRTVFLDGASLTLDALVAVSRRDARVALTPEARARVHAARAVVERRAERDEPAYGINTGFGSLSDVRIPRESLAQLQVNLVRSHAAGVGDPLPVDAVRATMLLRANVLAKGYSGIRVETLERLLDLLNARVHPRIPARGSVGASGDLAPLAHLALVLIGEGRTLDDRTLAAAGLAPAPLDAKEGLALINGTQPSAAVLALATYDAQRLADAADTAAAMSIDALRGSAAPFEARIHDGRPFEGQRRAAARMAALMADSDINRSHANCGRVQDAYCMRCAPQVHGAARDALAFVLRTLAIEMNAATDNPMVFVDARSSDADAFVEGAIVEGDIVSGGNFHGAPIALAADLLAIAVTHLATISERRTDRLLNADLSGLPPFLIAESGLHSGLMMAQVTAAALASELKGLAHPASVDTIPTSAGKEDHVSMSMTAALKAARAVELARLVAAIELVCAAQGLDLLRPLTSSAPLQRAHAMIRTRVAHLDRDRSPAPDIDVVASLIADGSLEDATAIEVKEKS
jgi:histidine ammonia-lyase